jgi:hypothetical protein
MERQGNLTRDLFHHQTPKKGNSILQNSRFSQKPRSIRYWGGGFEPWLRLSTESVKFVWINPLAMPLYLRRISTFGNLPIFESN